MSSKSNINIKQSKDDANTGMEVNDMNMNRMTMNSTSSISATSFLAATIGTSSTSSSLTSLATSLTNHILYRPPMSNHPDDSHTTDNSTIPSTLYAQSQSQSDHDPNRNLTNTMQSPCPFITPSLLCSNENPFLHLQQHLNNNVRVMSSDGSNIRKYDDGYDIEIGRATAMSNNLMATTNVAAAGATANTTLNTNSTNTDLLMEDLPSLTGTNINTPLQLLYSIYYIESDYYLNPPKSCKYQNDNDSIIPFQTWKEMNEFRKYMIRKQKQSKMSKQQQQQRQQRQQRQQQRKLSFPPDVMQIDDIGNGAFGSGGLGIGYNSSSSSRRQRDVFNYNTNYNRNRASERDIQLLQRRIRHEAEDEIAKKDPMTSTGIGAMNDTSSSFAYRIHKRYMDIFSKQLQENDNINHKKDPGGEEKEEEKEQLINILIEERDETIAQLTHLVLDSAPYQNLCIPCPNTNTATATAKTTNHHNIQTKNYMKYKPKSKSQQFLTKKYTHIPKRVCQHPFQKNDIVWVCRTCQADETCVLCHECFTNSDHEGHDVAFYHAQAGGCCDCGDEDAWDPKGFCHLHGGKTKGNTNDNKGLEKDIELKVHGIVNSCVEYVGLLAESVALGYERANDGRIVAERRRERYSNGNRRSSSISSSGDDEQEDEDNNNDMTAIEDNDNISSCSDNGAGHSTGKRQSSLVGKKRQSNKQYSKSNGSSLDEEINNTDITGRSEFHDTVIQMDISTSESVNQNDVSMLSLNNYDDENDVDMFHDMISPTSAKRDEFKFDPAAASTSKSRNNSPPTASFPPRSFKSALSTHGEEGQFQNNSTKEQKQNKEDQTFSPEAASKSKSRSYNKKKKLFHQLQQPMISAYFSPSHQLGLLGSQQDGLYLILHADDVNESRLIASALKILYQSFSSSALSSTQRFPFQDDPRYRPPPSISFDMISKIIPGLFHRKDSSIGDVIVCGTFELMEELGPVLSQCWKDGDSIACARFGALMLDKAKLLREKGMVVSIKTRVELFREVRALAVLEFLKMLSDCCDPLCNLVSLALGGYQNLDDDVMEVDEEPSTFLKTENNSVTSFNGGAKHLKSMLSSDLKLPRMMAKAWHDLLLKLLAVPNFKAALSNAYVDTYNQVAGEYARGVGILEKSSYTLSVQFLNRITYVQDLVRRKDLLGCLVRNLLETMQIAKLSKNDSNTRSTNERLDITHSIVTHRRYMPPISDLKCVLNVPGIAHLFSSIPRSMTFSNAKVKNCLDAWIDTLSLTQNMDLQKWRTHDEGHVRVESTSWITAFNLSISLGSLFERLLLWKDEDCHPEKISDSYSMTFLNAVELTQYVLISGVDVWQRAEINGIGSVSFDQKTSELQSLTYLPMSKAAINHGCPLGIYTLPVSQEDSWSFHLPLYRFLSACLKEVARRPYQIDGRNYGFDRLLVNLKRSMNSQVKLELLFNGLLEFPTIILSRAAQIRSNIWKRNGKAMKFQVLNYAEPSFCKSLRDADLLLLQFALIGNCFLSEGEKSDDYLKAAPVYQRYNCANFVCLLIHRFGIFNYLGFEIALQAKSGELNPTGASTFSSLCTVTKDADRLCNLLDEFLHLLIIIITELPPPQSCDEAEYLQQAKRRLRREVVHRLVSGPKTHSDLSEVHHVLPHQDNVSRFFDFGNYK